MYYLLPQILPHHRPPPHRRDFPSQRALRQVWSTSLQILSLTRTDLKAVRENCCFIVILIAKYKLSTLMSPSRASQHVLSSRNSKHKLTGNCVTLSLSLTQSHSPPFTFHLFSQLATFQTQNPRTVPIGSHQDLDPKSKLFYSGGEYSPFPPYFF